jgi:hypothetical protein
MTESHVMILKCVRKKVIWAAKYSLDFGFVNLIIYILEKVDSELSLATYEEFSKLLDLSAFSQ